MGEVYVAEDESLNRAVALKILPPNARSLDGRLRRFVSEAQTASSLSHPNLVTIHEIGEATIDGDGPTGSLPFIAMELVRGQTLAEIFEHSRPPLREMVGWLAQAASGLAAVHGAGIVHRDLKPANIIVGFDGQVRVLDFGLAKISAPAGDRSADTIEQTAEGMVVGTLHYMSPEQVEGKSVDQRSDIFSFGCILYEAATGRRPFTGTSRVDIMHAILHEKPAPIHDLNAEVPTELRRLIRRSLAKERESRFQSIKDVAILMGELLEEWDGLSRDVSTSSSATRALRRKGVRPPAVLAIAAVLVMGAAITLLWWKRQGRVDRPRFQFAAVTSRDGIEFAPSLSPDGNFVVYQSDAAGNWDLYLLRVGGRNDIPLTAECDADDMQPAFSPDGQTISFRSERDGGGIFLMGSTGESVRRLTSEGFYPAWSPDGRQIVYSTEGPPNPYGRISVSALWAVDVASGKKTKIHDGDAVEPDWSPDGRWIVFWGLPDARGSDRDIGMIPAGGGPVVWLTRDAAIDWSPIWSADGSEIYFSSDRGGTMNLWCISLDRSSGNPSGPPQAVVAPARWVGHLSRSADGSRILFDSLQTRSSIERLALDPRALTAAGEPQTVTRETQLFAEMDVSPRGDRVVFRTSVTSEDLVVARTDGTEFVRLTNDAHRDRAPRWSADGRWIVFYSDRDGRYEAWRVHPDGSGIEQLTRQSQREVLYPSLSPDGRRLAAYDFERGTFLVELVAPLPSNRLHAIPPPNANEIFLGARWSAGGSGILGFNMVRKSGSGGAAVQVTALSSYSVNDGTYRELLRLPKPVQFVSGSWTADGRAALLTTGSSIVLYDLEAGSSRPMLEARGDVFESVSIPADSSTLYFTRHVYDSDLWLARERAEK